MPKTAKAVNCFKDMFNSAKNTTRRKVLSAGEYEKQLPHVESPMQIYAPCVCCAWSKLQCLLGKCANK